jgi:hypothetical protein
MARTKMKSARQTNAKVIEQSETLQDEIKEIDIQLEQLKEKRAALSQAVLMAVKEEQGEEEKEEERRPEEIEMSENSEETNLSLLQWRPFGPGKKGEWTFATDREGRLLQQLEHSSSLLSSLKERQRVNIGGYNYKMSENGRFLHRFPDEESR